MCNLILFDIDGTLVHSGGAGARAMNLALEDLTGIPDGFKGIDCSGKTDLLIIKEAFEILRLNDEDELLEELLTLYIARLEQEVRSRRGYLIPGVLDLLNTLTPVEDIHLGLLTGNIEQGARLKLDPHGLNRYFPLGAFGDDDEDRNRLLPFAVLRLRDMLGVSVDYRHCVVIGDTPRDVACSKIHGASCIAVATGTHSIEALQDTRADLVVANLSDTGMILDWLSTV